MAGAIVTWFFIPEMPRDLASEDLLFKEYLEANGWETSGWGESLVASAPKEVVQAIEERSSDLADEKADE